jgi:glycosyltransferase involved in cell wall biosynthesis
VTTRAAAGAAHDDEAAPEGTRGEGRLLVLTSTWPRWAGDTTASFVRNLTGHLVTLGWQASVLAPHAAGAAHQERDGGVDVHRFRYLWPESAQTVCYGSGALVNLRRRPFDLAKVPLLVAAEQGATIAAVRRGRPDVIHAHWLVPQGLVAGLVPGRDGPPAVVTVHGGDVFALDQPGLRAAKRMAVRRATAITVNSSATERAVLDLGADRSKVHIVPMGIDVDRRTDPTRVAAIRRRHGDDGHPLCVFVGRVLAEKGVLDLVDAVAAAAADGRRIDLAVVGEGQDRRAAEHRARARGVTDRITFAGWVEPDAIPDWLAAADIVAAPSRTAANGWTEAQGLTIIEAMAAERPVVATRTGGIGDAITHGETGVLVAEGDPVALARAVLDLHDHPDRAARLARAARRRAVERYAAARTAAQMSDVLVEARLAGRSRS